MNFYTSLSKEKVKYPCVILGSDNFDDFTFKTTFISTFYNDHKTKIDLGKVKIMALKSKDENGRIQLPTDFKKLRIEYCSLGYDISYYKKIRELSLKYNIHLKEILDGLRDAACFSGIREKFEEEPAFRNSLLRESESKTSLIYGEAIINGGKLSPYIHFTYC